MNKLLKLLTPLILFASCKNSSTKPGNQADVLRDKAIILKQLNSPADSVSAEPYLFTDKNGLVYMSWIERTNGLSFLKFSTLTNEQWAAPSVISSGDNWFVNWADYPLLVSDGANNMVAHFLEKSDSGKYTYDVKLVNSVDGGKSWSAGKILHDDGKKAEHGFVSMVPFGENYFVSWLDGRNAAAGADEGHDQGHHGQMTIRGAIIDNRGNKSGEWELDNRVCDCCQTSAAITANGPIVIYRDRSEKEIRDISIVRMVNGQWIKPTTIFPDNWTIDGCPVNGPRADAVGNKVGIAWFSSPNKNAQVNVVFSTDGGATFNTPIRIDEGKGIGRVDLVMLDEKTAMVSWMEGAVIKAAKVHSDGEKESSIIISSSSEARSSGFPQMTRSGDQVIFAWTDDKEKTIKVASLVVKPTPN